MHREAAAHPFHDGVLQRKYRDAGGHAQHAEGLTASTCRRFRDHCPPHLVTFCNHPWHHATLASVVCALILSPRLDGHHADVGAVPQDWSVTRVARLRIHCRASEGCYLAQGLQARASEVITNLAFYAG